MPWESLLSTIHKWFLLHRPSDVLIIQLRKNDLGVHKGKDLAHAAMENMQTLLTQLPNTIIFLSDLLEQQSWYWARCSEKVGCGHAEGHQLSWQGGCDAGRSPNPPSRQFLSPGSILQARWAALLQVRLRPLRLYGHHGLQSRLQL